MNFEGDAFISYAHLDNIELVEGRKGWVANLHRALEIRVGQLLGKQPHIWRDPKLSGNDLFADTLVEQLRRVAILVTVISPRYLKSEWTIRELTEFWREAEKQGGIHVRNKARVFKVLKTPVPLDRMPQELQSLIGYDFFKVDLETGRVRELDEVFGADAHRDFWLKLDDLAHDIVALLESMEGAGVVPKGTVYLAETTSDLRDARETLKRDLLEQGFVVLPDRTLSHVASEAADAIRDALARSSLSIHLLGRHHGIVPEGGTESLSEMQYELAASENAGSLARLVWIPDGLQLDDERQKALLARVRNDPRTGSNADLLETYLEDLRAAVAERLKPKEPAKAPAAAAPAESGAARPPQVYIVADVRDADALAPLVDGLFAQHVEVIPPIFDGDESEIREYHEESLVHCDGVLIFYGAGNQLWLQRRLRELQKAPGYGRTKPQPAVAVALAGPRTPEKERFRTHEASVVPQWDGFALDPLVPFLMALKAGRSA
jgi:hypothetical protein